MNKKEFQLQGVGDVRLAVHATSALPVWLWSSDGIRVLWANPVGAALFEAPNATELAKRIFGPADIHRRQVVQLAGKLPLTGATRMERLRGFGAAPGMLMTCGCARLEFPDGSHGILVAPVEARGPRMPMIGRLQRLVEDVEMPVASFTRDGLFVAASDTARVLLGFNNLLEAGLDAARIEALTAGRAETTIAGRPVVLQRVGTGSDTGLVAMIAPQATPVAPVQVTPVTPVQAENTGKLPDPMANRPWPDYEQPDMLDEAPAEFALADTSAQSVLAANPNESAPATEPAAAPEVDAPAHDVPVWLAEMADGLRPHPLRFLWEMDLAGRFSLESDQFVRLIGPHAATALGGRWRDIAEVTGLDPDGRVLKAVATRETWTAIALDWPVDDAEPLPVELSGLPVYDRSRRFAGYRGFGICRDLDGLRRVAELRRHQPYCEPSAPEQETSRHEADTVPAESGHEAAADPPAKTDVMAAASPHPPVSCNAPTSQHTDMDDSLDDSLDDSPDTPELVEAPWNVVPFRPLGEKAPMLTPGENHAFNELARQLSARLDLDNGDAEPDAAAFEPAGEAAGSPPVTDPMADVVPIDARSTTPASSAAIQPANAQAASTPPASTPPEWLAPPPEPARGESQRDRTLLDLLPTGVLIYRLDRLIYANPAFLHRMGYPDLHALEHAGGLDALYVEAGVSTASSTSEAGTPVTISAASEHALATEARLFTISWDGESALALMFTPTLSPAAPAPAEPVAATPVAEPPELAGGAGHADAEDLAAILDTTAEGIVMFDAQGKIHACNRSAEALFGYDGDDFAHRNLTELFAPESQRVVVDYLESIKDGASLPDPGRDVLGSVSHGGIIPLSLTMGRTRPQGPNFFAVFRDLSQVRKGEGELQQARRLAERSAGAKADMLARISHEVRTPLNAIIGFAEVMIGERFGPLGNERYVEYMKDIRASGERVVAIVNDLTELSRIETGKIELAFTNQNLNEMVESCVAVTQSQANRERIIIRTSLAPMLPPVIADARALRQITLNLIGNSIHLANPGGQVIVSTALSDFGDVVLRVRDTGHGLNDNEVAAALEPFRTPAPSDQGSDNSGVNLSLTKALVEANRAQFHIKTGGRSGTLVEVVFTRELARA